MAEDCFILCQHLFVISHSLAVHEYEEFPGWTTARNGRTSRKSQRHGKYAKESKFKIWSDQFNSQEDVMRPFNEVK